MGRIALALKSHPAVVGPYSRLLERRTRRTEVFAFVATTGRSGTTTLSDLFDGVPGCTAEHEPYPSMISDWPASLDCGTAAGLAEIAAFHEQRYSTKKYVNILRQAAGKRLYLESNHQFIKNYAELAFRSFGDRMRVVHLTRDVTSVSKSFFAIDSIPGRTEMGRLYMIDPRQLDNVLRIGDVLETDPSFGHDYYRCLWYWYETEARTVRFQLQHPSVPVLSCTTGDLNSPASLGKLISFLRVDDVAEQILKRSGHRTNEKLDEKKRAVGNDEAEAMHARLKQLLLDRCDHRYLPSLRPTSAP